MLYGALQPITLQGSKMQERSPQLINHHLHKRHSCLPAHVCRRRTDALKNRLIRAQVVLPVLQKKNNGMKRKRDLQNVHIGRLINYN